MNYPLMLQAFQFDFYGPAEVLVVGPKNESNEMLRSIRKTFLPGKVLVFAEENQVKDLTNLIPWVEGRTAQGGKPTAYVCRNYQCQLPTTDGLKLLSLLSER